MSITLPLSLVSVSTRRYGVLTDFPHQLCVGQQYCNGSAGGARAAHLEKCVDDEVWRLSWRREQQVIAFENKNKFNLPCFTMFYLIRFKLNLVSKEVLLDPASGWLSFGPGIVPEHLAMCGDS